jgi:tRNA1(Val) A37 N6-methylase TrmN6
MAEIYDLPDDDLIDLLMKGRAFASGRAGTPICADGSGAGEGRGSREEEIASLDRLLSLAQDCGDMAIPNPTAHRIRSQIIAGQDPLGEHYSRLRSPEERREIGATLTPLKIVQSMTAWAAAQVGSGQPAPVRVIDPGAGTGRFAIAAARAFPGAEIVAVESDPDLALLLRANLKVLGLSSRVHVLVSDFRGVNFPFVAEPTVYIGNPPYVRHHKIAQSWKRWYAATCAARGIAASQLAGMHLHFFAKVAEIARDGDFGCFITAAEWLDVGYGAALRSLLADGLGGTELHVVEPTAEAFPGTMATAAITTFAVGRRRKTLTVRRVVDPSGLDRLEGGSRISWEKIARTSRWSILVRGGSPPPPGMVALGELCRVHRGQVTGANRIWIAGPHTARLPARLLWPTVTSAAELIAAGEVLDDAGRLRRVVDLPPDLDVLSPEERDTVERFIAWAKSAGAAEGYIARHRTPWWAVRLTDPAPIVCTYMARRPPAFVRNRADARLLNIAHGIYPREPMSESQLMALVRALQTTVSRSDGRTYSGGLTKFEPGELERVPIPRPETHA